MVKKPSNNDISEYIGFNQRSNKFLYDKY